MSLKVTQYELRFPKYFPDGGPLVLRDYAGALNKYTQELCKTVLGGENADIKTCVQEVKMPVDCIVRNKARKLGFMDDNIKLCSGEIRLMRQKMTKKYKGGILEKTQAFTKFDDAFEKLQKQMKAFV